METKKLDRRTLKTRKAIADALAELLMEKELRKVTVQEIADKSDVNRVTFYNHFLEVYDLYDKMERAVLTEMGLLMLELKDLKIEEFYAQLVKYIDDNKAVFRLIFCPNSSAALRSKFTKLIEGVFHQILSEDKNVELKDVHLSYQNCYRAHGFISVIEKWVNEGFKESDRFIIDTISELDLNTQDLIMYE